MDLKTAAGDAVLALPDMAGQAVSNIIAFAAMVISAAVAIYVFIRTEGRERRVEKSSAYLSLEVHSSDLFGIGPTTPT